MRIGDRIKEERERKGFSQQELANRSGLSVRTIQRIESGQNHPQGHSIRAICSELNLPIDSFSKPFKKDKNLIQLLYFLPIFGLAFPFGNVVVPLVYFLYNREKSSLFRRHAKNLLFWQALLSIVLGSLLIMAMLSKLAHVQMPVFGNLDIIAFSLLANIVVFGIVPLTHVALIEFWGVRDYYPPVFKR